MRSEAIHSVIRAYDDPIVRAYCWGRFGILRQRFLDEIGQYLPARGRVLDVGPDGGIRTVGRVLAWESTPRLVFTLEIDPPGSTATEVEVRYHRAAYFDETLTVWTRCVDVRGARFTYEYRIERDGELVADGFTKHAAVDRETYRPTRIPDWLVEALART